MWLNDKEERIIKEFLDIMENASKEDVYELEWEDGTKIIGYCDTIYESDNDLEIEDPNYEEYWGIAICIADIINRGKVIEGKNKNDLLEINYHNMPSEYKKVS